MLVLVVALASCGEKEKPKKKKLTAQEVDYLSEQMNKWDEKRQEDEINQYIKAHHYEMQQTASGLRYMLMKKGDGKQAEMGMTARVAYKIYSLGGTVYYTASPDSAKEFVIGKDNVESGLHEGVQLMHVGDKMMFILPSYLAHGLTGDQGKIPPLTTVVYEIELLGLK